ncbi:hypothetical protein [Paraglaciecola sp. L3A3]|uniref:hypothetical protein n=1 Tax=Paraglaciecola sp. L3A3 TaxID=2686358 RepID=UPI00131BB633|nr:hypothetical protein [Paraglaciecola sp. L3A3]
MQKNEAALERNRSLFINILVVVVFLSLTAVFIHYLYNSSADIRRLSLEKLADTFSASVNNAHWQWQAEGRPEKLMVSTYSSQLGEGKKLVETKSQSILMSVQGWPKTETNVNGCIKIWNMMLGFPLELEGLEVLVDYYDGKSITGNSIDEICRYRLSSGAYFEYKMNLGQVLQIKN